MAASFGLVRRHDSVYRVFLGWQCSQALDLQARFAMHFGASVFVETHCV
jgi:hypothetical protein